MNRNENAGNRESKDMEMVENVGSCVNNRLRIYIAGPEVFLRDAIRIGAEKKDLCTKYGFEGIYPFDVEAGTDAAPQITGLSISRMNESLIRKCDILIANITPFRGISADVGTAYEMGYARALGKHVYAYTNIVKLFSERVQEYFCDTVIRDSDGMLRDSHGMKVEEWGLIDNLMIDGAVDVNNNIVVVDNVPDDQIYTVLTGFERCLDIARTHIL